MDIANQIRPLSPAEALARLSVVSLIQLIGLGATLLLIWVGPQWFDATTVAAWQLDCLKIAVGFGLVTLIALLVFAVFATTSLFALSVVVTVFAYWAPLRPEFVSLIQRIRSRFRE